MANYDNQMADRVWQRVRSTGERTELNLQGLIQQEAMGAAGYQQLARMLGGRDGALLEKIAREELDHAACLRGICKIMKGECPGGKIPRPVGENPGVMLRRAFAGELKSMGEYEALTSHPEYGHVFASLAGQERAHSRIVLEILGRVEKLK